MEAIVDWVKSGLIFGMVGSLVLMLSPNKSYEKIINYVVGLLFLLVMINPLMKFFAMDQETFLHTMEDYLSLGTGYYEASSRDKELYLEALSMQLGTVFENAGYEIDEIQLEAFEDGSISSVKLSLKGAVYNTEGLEEYLKNLFGEEVSISYEYK